MSADTYIPNWPKKGDQFFRGDLPDWQHNAVVGAMPWGGDIAPWRTYVDGYREAADRVVFSLLQQEPRPGLGMKESLLYPVVFLYRHHFELVLKTIIRIGSRMFDENDAVPHTHDLLQLWNRARTILTQHWPGDPEPLDAAEPLLVELNGFDSGSFAFRYPEARDRTASLPDGLHVNLRHLAETAGRLSEFLTCCADGLWNDLGDKESFESDMREMYRDEGW